MSLWEQILMTGENTLGDQVNPAIHLPCIGIGSTYMQFYANSEHKNFVDPVDSKEAASRLYS
jgi:hypothetical protein